MPDNIPITHIELQNPRKKTYALYQNDTFITEITEDTLVYFSISGNSVFSKQEFNKILEHDKVNLCLIQAYNYLRRRPHLKKELQRKLLKKQFSQQIIDKAFLHLKKNNYINDDEYIKLFIRDSVRQAKSGPLLIKKKLAEKGAHIYTVEKFIDELYTFEQQSTIAFRLLKNKNAKINDESFLKRKQKLQRFGYSRGFNWHVLESIINTLVQDDDF